MIDLVVAEWLKLRTTRLPTLAVVIIAGALLAVFVILHVTGVVGPASP